MKQQEINITSALGKKLFVKSWHPNAETKAVVVLVHGFGEHCARYTPYIDFFTKQQIAFVSYDQHGHGRSEGKRGTIISYKQLLDDVALIISKAKELFPNTPQFLYGHSMGGNIALNYLLQRKPDLAGGIISSPWLKLHKDPPTILKTLVSGLQGILPNLTANSGLDTKYISTIKNEVDIYNNDPLNHGRISLRLVYEITKHGVWAMNNTRDLITPSLFVHGSGDQITSAPATKTAANNNSEQITFYEFDGMYHEIHNDTKRENLAKLCIEWIDEQLK